MVKIPFRLTGNVMAAALAGGVGVAAFAGGMVGAPSPPAVDVAQATRNDWRDLLLRPDQAAKDIAVLAARRPWGAPAVDPAAAAAAAAAANAQGGALQGVSNSVPWRITGVARQGERYMAVLTQTPPGQPAKSGFLKVGEKLPDGRLIAGIDPDAIEVESASGRQRIRLYWPKT